MIIDFFFSSYGLNILRERVALDKILGIGLWFNWSLVQQTNLLCRYIIMYVLCRYLHIYVNYSPVQRLRPGIVEVSQDS